MSELTDLEICEQIADIEGKEYVSSDGVIYVIGELFGKAYKELYSPLTSKALCFDLMVKYNINFSLWNGNYRSSCMWDVKDDCYYIDILDKNPQRAICLAVIKKHEAL